MRTVNRHASIPRRRQAGAALAIALVFLLVMTLIGVTAMQTTTLQERMAGNMRDRQVAFQAAEAALRDAEEYLNQAVIGPFNGSGGLYKADSDNPVWEDFNWDNPPGGVRAADFDSAGQDPVYIIEEIEQFTAAGQSLAADTPAAVISSYRVTTRGTGMTQDAVVILQTTFRRQ